MGLLNSAIAAGAITGAIVPSFVADAFGYRSLPLLATGVLVLAFAIGLPVFRRGPSPGPAATPPPQN
jgi:predicted MFS family arabinose efflux permease